VNRASNRLQSSGDEQRIALKANRTTVSSPPPTASAARTASIVSETPALTPFIRANRQNSTIEFVEKRLGPMPLPGVLPRVFIIPAGLIGAGRNASSGPVQDSIDPFAPHFCKVVSGLQNAPQRFFGAFFIQFRFLKQNQ